MKIEKGKLYYCHQLESFIKAIEDYDDKGGLYTDKIAVHCPNRDDWDYVNKYYPTNGWHSLGGEYRDLRNEDCFGLFPIEAIYYHVLSIEEFKKFYPEECVESSISVKDLHEINYHAQPTTTNIGHKETSNKLNYELDFDFITQMAERMQANKGKYEPYNWKKPIDIESLAQAIFRHTLEIMKGNYEDDSRELGHLEAIACNAMMLNYQLKSKKPN